ncbi:MAG TPA: flagellar assembly protein FliW [Candidatus Udaeobacter sp.]|nr:flagellar assembly protein FliW [Candidatus Udaeobacter sp.]
MSIESTVFYFENGIPGFEHLHQFAFTEVDGELPMKLMKSVEDEEISLLIVNPFSIYPEYEWDLPDSSKQELFIQSELDIEIWSIITVNSEPLNSTINLMAPLVLNINKKIGKQLILHDNTYSSRAPLIRA